jgi:hypothetical protein
MHLIVGQLQVVDQPQTFFGNMLALNGILNASRHKIGRNGSLNEIALGAMLKRLQRGGIVVAAGKNDQRQMRRLGFYAVQHGNPLAVGQTRIQQDDVDLRILHLRERIGEFRSFSWHKPMSRPAEAMRCVAKAPRAGLRT